MAGVDAPVYMGCLAICEQPCLTKYIIIDVLCNAFVVTYIRSVAISSHQLLATLVSAKRA